MTRLKISDHFSLPMELVTSTQAILAKRRVGKSYTASVQAEEMLKARQQIVAIDPTGAWHGLRSSADGKSPGYSIAVFGGEHADVPLEESAGEIVASAIVADRFSAIIDLSLFRKGQLNRFMAAFLETLYRLNREAMHLFVDEADAVAPQKPFGEEARTLGAMQDVVRRGGIKGIGCTLITQRPAVLNKDVLTQCEVLTALRLVHPRDIDAVMEWVNVHGDPKTAKAMVDSLPSLPVGTAWVWSPGLDIFERIQVRARETFDSGATPKPGQSIKPPKVLASIDVKKLGAQIEATVERVKENDPKVLKAKIVALTKELSARPTVKPETKIVEKPVVTDKAVKGVERIVDKMIREGDRRVAAAEALAASGRELAEQAKQFTAALRSASAAPTPGGRSFTTPPAGPPVGVKADRSARPVAPKPPAEVGDLKISKTQQRILDALAWYESLGNPQPKLTQIGAVALIDTTGGHFSNTVGPLSTAGLVIRGDGALSLTDAGRAIAVVPEETGTLDDYHEVLRNRVRKMKSAGGKTIEVLDAIIAAGGEPITTEQIGQAVNIDHTGGHFSNTIGPLSTAGLIVRRGGVVTPTEVLFPLALVNA